MVKGWHSRGYLPHFDGGEIAQFVTFRLADSLPKHLLERWQLELASGKTAVEREIELRRRIETYLDAGAGNCYLREPKIAEVVENALFFFDGERYRLSAWVIMPNHIHFLLTPTAGQSLSRIVQSLKTHTAQTANKILRRTGSFWQGDYYDRYVRNAEHFAQTVKYIQNNPVTAELSQRSGDWRFSSAFWHQIENNASQKI